MIEPNMATMLCYVMTDATVKKKDLQSVLSDAVDQSFNSISVDGDKSTSDTAVLVASNQMPLSSLQEFQQAVLEVCWGLSADIVRNGEGTGHVMRVKITNFGGSNYDARHLGRHICNSPLFKCPVSGNDPNTGRLAGAVGLFMGKFFNDNPMDNVTLTLGGRIIFSQGQFVEARSAVD